MPKVGDKHFAYTKKGIAAAKAEAKKAGKTLKSDAKKTKKALKSADTKAKSSLKKGAKSMEKDLSSGLKKAYKSGGKVSKKKSGAKTITARGSGAARPQKFYVTIGG